MTRSELSPKLKKSLVVGIHNWKPWLFYALPSLAKTCRYVDELIFVFDRLSYAEERQCRNLVNAYIDIADIVNPCHSLILYKQHAKWQHRPAETFSYGFSYATGDILYVSAEDIILDPANFQDKHWRDPSVGIVDFRYYQHDITKFNFHVAWDDLILKVSDKLFNYGSVRSGLYGIRRTVYDEVGGLIDCPTEEDWLRKTVISHGYKHRHVKSTHNLHLRPSYNKQRQIMQGVSRRHQRFSLKRTVAHSMLHLKPWVLWGYLKCGDMDGTQREAYLTTTLVS